MFAHSVNRGGIPVVLWKILTVCATFNCKLIDSILQTRLVISSVTHHEMKGPGYHRGYDSDLCTPDLNQQSATESSGYFLGLAIMYLTMETVLES